jgi:hypothetical protein
MDQNESEFEHLNMTEEPDTDTVIPDGKNKLYTVLSSEDLSDLNVQKVLESSQRL